MKVMINNESGLSMNDIGYMIDKMNLNIKQYLGEPIMYHSDSGISAMIVINIEEHDDYEEWHITKAAN